MHEEGHRIERRATYRLRRREWIARRASIDDEQGVMMVMISTIQGDEKRRQMFMDTSNSIGQELAG
jgi:hypothetical protein